ncbi:MAG: rod shape-determining protein RodA [Patescibacteria group bacterium]
MLKTLRFIKDMDWTLLIAVFSVVSLGLVTMHSFSGDDSFFSRQLILLVVSFSVFFIVSIMDFRFLRRTGVVVSLFLVMCGALISLFVVGKVTQGAQRWLEIGPFSLQVSEFAKIVIIILLAKYFTKRHIDIASLRHIFVSGFYTAVFFLLVFFQPDFGSAIIIGVLWLGMVMVSGISLKHLGLVFLIGVITFSGMWVFGLQDYQKERVLSFLEPFADIEGGAYHVRQSTIAIGSGEIFGKGIGYGTQSQLKFLPEHQTDFIFAAFAEEWGFLGVILLFSLYGVIFWRLLANAAKGETNFEALFGIGIAVLFMSHIVIHIGANVGILPVTGTTLPFMSYGGSHLFVSFLALGIVMSMRHYRRVVSREAVRQEVGLS